MASQMDRHEVRIKKSDIEDYIAKGPGHHVAQVYEFVNNVKTLVKSMDNLMEDDPITMMIAGIKVEVTVKNDSDTTLLHMLLGGGADDTSTEAGV